MTDSKHLALLAVTAGSALQEIQDIVKRDHSAEARVRFPRGYIRPTSSIRKRFSFLNNKTLESNISYLIQLSDVLDWILNRTDISMIAKSMVIKNKYFLLGAILESVTKVMLKGKCGKPFEGRIDYLALHGMIDDADAGHLKRVWLVRNRFHMYGCDTTDYTEEFTMGDLNLASEAYGRLIDTLSVQNKSLSRRA